MERDWVVVAVLSLLPFLSRTRGRGDLFRIQLAIVQQSSLKDLVYRSKC